MATTRYAFSPLAAEFPSTNYAALTVLGSTTYTRPVLAFADGASALSAYWAFTGWQGISGALSIVAHICQSGTSGNGTYWSAAVEAITPGDSLNLNTADGFDTANAYSGWTPSTTAYYLTTMSITLTNADGIAAGDFCRLKLTRDPTQAGDTNAGTMYVVLVELREA